jgi:hypothetical protein
MIEGGGLVIAVRGEGPFRHAQRRRAGAVEAYLNADHRSGQAIVALWDQLSQDPPER